MSIVRRHSRKRDAILECLRCTTSHPTAEWVYNQLKPTIPDLSLATVYRNLAMFKAEGTIDSVGVYNGLELGVDPFRRRVARRAAQTFEDRVALMAVPANSGHRQDSLLN